MIGAIATHRTDVTVLWMSDDVEVWDEIIHHTRYTQYPVCEGSIDHIVGILNAKDYFRLKEKTKEAVLRAAISAPYFVIETTKADVLFQNMKKEKHSIAVVLDEYGGMSGIVTIFDLLEELVGNLKDVESTSLVEETIEKTGEGKWEIRGNLRLSDIADAIGVVMSAEDCETFTGFVFQTLGIVPKDGDANIELEVDHLRITIDKIKEHRVEHAVIELLDS